ncbi:IPT/TIG domain-containing protein [Luteimonas abyssi]|uniref:IPT/TIG domain-containing protein n=1 Tax=Luteimonas abyssi TaxID=1247514 RepID=UPI000737C83B|nr:IPT/TIG domain-containing protein [Luteimonas abyssi]
MDVIDRGWHRPRVTGWCRVVIGAGVRRFSAWAAVTLCILVLAALAGRALATSYVYDANGRLVVVTNDAGESARYVYDAMGNLLRVERLGEGDLAIFAFTPGRGAPGVRVRIQGHGFASIAAQNALTFNGVPAVVESASTGELIAVVPVGATTGPVRVDVDAASASSTTAFVVDPASRPPVIQSVSPLIGTPGTPITVLGQHLSPVTGQTSARLNLRPAPLSLVQDSTVVFAIPSSTGSGKVFVQTPFGIATSAQDVLVVPPGTNAATVTESKRVHLDGAIEAFGVAATGDSSAALFDGALGDYVNAQFFSLTGNVAYTLFDPVNRPIASGTVTVASPTLLMPRLPATGTYLLLMRPATGPAAWSVRLQRAPIVHAEAEPLVTQTEPGQSVRLALPVEAGQHLGIGLADLGVSSGTYVRVSLSRPDGTVSISSTMCYQSGGGCGFNLSPVQSGYYSITVTPQSGSQTMSFKTTVSADVSGVLERDEPQAVQLPRRGQNGRFTFDAQAGETLALQVAAQTTVPVGKQAYYRVYRPDGTQLAVTNTATSATLNLPQLPETGTYVVLVDPYDGASLEAGVVLSSGRAGGEEVDGAHGEHALDIPGQNLYLTFHATQGQRLGLGISDLVVSSGSYVGVRVLRPDGSQQSSANCSQSNGGCGFNLSIGTTGTYAVVITPQSATQMSSFRTTLSTDLVGALPRNAAQAVALPRRGQNARLRFAATAGETLALRVSGQTAVPVGWQAYYTVFRPDGTQLASTNTATATTLNMPNLPETGEYTVLVDPYHGATLASQVLLASGTTGDGEVGGDPAQYDTTVPGQTVYTTFSAQEGQRLGLGISDLAVSTGSYVTVRVNRPDGTALVNSTTCSQSSGGCGFNLSANQTGVYSLTVTPQTTAQTMSFRTTLSVDMVGTLERDVPQTLALPRRGQNARLWFDATAGETLTLRVSDQTTTPAGKQSYYRIYRPDGTQLATSNTATGAVFNFPNLPESGAYYVLVDPYDGAALESRLLLASGAIGDGEIGGAVNEYRTEVPGQNVYLTFQATEGQRLGLAISDLAVSSGTYVQALITRPDGSTLVSWTVCYQSNGGCGFNLTANQTGTYGITVAPQSVSQMMSFRTTLSADMVGVLEPDMPQTLQLTRRGQNARFTFEAEAGQTLALQVAGQATIPVGKQAYYRVHRPDGTQIAVVNTATSATLNLPQLPESGEYVVFVDPYDGASLEAEILLSSGTIGGEEIDGAEGDHELGIPGQNLYLTFQATEGQRLGLGISDLVVSSGSYVSVRVLRPDGSQQSSVNCSQSNGGCGFNLSIGATGTYAVVVTPQSATQTSSFKTTLSTDLVSTLPRNAAQTVALPRRGQNARLRFTATAGETLALRVSEQASVPVVWQSYYTVFRPDGTQLASTNTATTATLNMPNLPESGEYVVVVDPYFGAALVSKVLLASGTTGDGEVDGEPAQYETTVPGQTVYTTFSAQEGQRLGLGISELSVSNGAYVNVRINRPDGTALVSSTACYQSNGGCGFNLLANLTGIYSLTVTPQTTGQMMSFTSTLSVDIAGTLARDVPQTLSLPRRGQNARLWFDATAGETLALRVSGQVAIPAGKQSYYRIYRPDGTQLATTNTATGAVFNFPNLPETGAYYVLVDPYDGAALESQVLLASGTTGEGEVGGEVGEYETTVPGQNVYQTFQATEGERLGLGISALAISSGTYVNVSVLRPDGTALVNSTICYRSNDGCGFNLSPNQTGTYTLRITPQTTSQTMSFKTTLSADLRGMLERDVPQTLQLPRRGQNARFTFDAQAGETLALQVAGQATVPMGRQAYYRVYRPNGAQLAFTNTATSTTLNLPQLPETGEYLVFVDPYDGESLEAEIVLSSGTAGGEEIDGTEGDHELGIPGQNLYLTFQATEGQRLGLGISDLVVSSGSYVSVRVLRPDGSQQSSVNCSQSNGGCGFNLSIGTTGTYAVVVTPQSATQTSSFKTTLSNDLIGTLPRNVTQAVTLPRRGQNARLRFSATAGETVTLRMSGQTTVPVGWQSYYTVFRPDGTQLASTNIVTATTLNLPNLPETGDYTVVVDPYHGATLASQVLLASGTTDDVDVGDDPAGYETTVPGQIVYMNFSAQEGQRLGLGISDLVVSSGSLVRVAVSRPDGTSLVNATACSQSSGGCGFNLSANQTGIYQVTVTPEATGQTMSFTSTLSVDIAGTLARDVPQTLSLPRRGQNARLWFDATAGETLALRVSGQVAIPAGKQSYYRIYRPDGTQLATTNTATGTTLSIPAIPVAGAYYLLVDPYDGASLSSEITLVER